MVSALACDVRAMGLIPALYAIFPIFISPCKTGAVAQDLVQAMWCIIAKPTLYIYTTMYIYKMRRRKPEPTLLPTQRIFNLPHHIGMV